MTSIERTADEIADQLAEAWEDEGSSRWPGMTYEQGVAAALAWVLGESSLPPLSED
jgi:hypothetical protein